MERASAVVIASSPYYDRQRTNYLIFQFERLCYNGMMGGTSEISDEVSWTCANSWQTDPQPLYILLVDSRGLFGWYLSEV